MRLIAIALVVEGIIPLMMVLSYTVLFHSNAQCRIIHTLYPLQKRICHPSMARNEENGAERDTKKRCVAKDKKEKESRPKDISKALVQELTRDCAAEYMVKNETARVALKTFSSCRYANCALLRGAENVCRSLLECIEQPMTVVSASEIGNAEDTFRRAANIRFSRNVTVFEGEVLSSKINRDDAGKVRSIELTLHSAKGKKTIFLGSGMLEAVSQINEGDLVYVEPASGLIKRVGRCESRIDEYDLEGDNYMPVNKGTVVSQNVRSALLSLYDFDYALNCHSDDISCFTRSHTDRIIQEYSEKGHVELVESFLVVTKAGILDAQKCAVLQRCIRNCPWVKLVLTGESTMDLPSFDNCIAIETVAEEPGDIIRAMHRNIDIDKKAVTEHIKQLGIEIVSDILDIVSTAEDYLIMVKPLLK